MNIPIEVIGDVSKEYFVLVSVKSKDDVKFLSSSFGRSLEGGEQVFPPLLHDAGIKE